MISEGKCSKCHARSTGDSQGTCCACFDAQMRRRADHLQAFVLANINMKLTPHCTEGILARCGGVVGWYVALVLSGNLRAILNQSLLVYAPADLHLQWS